MYDTNRNVEPIQVHTNCMVTHRSNSNITSYFNFELNKIMFRAHTTGNKHILVVAARVIVPLHMITKHDVTIVSMTTEITKPYRSTRFNTISWMCRRLALKE